MDHVGIARDASERHDIEQRLTGRFYTPAEIVDRLVDLVVAQGCAPQVLGDPFCGDGRLVTAWLLKAHRTDPRLLRNLREIILWDCDGAAVPIARDRVMSTLQELAVEDCHVTAQVCDSIKSAQTRAGEFDVLLTNPPWELLKPDTRDNLQPTSRVAYVTALREYAGFVIENFPHAAGLKDKSMAGYRVNLARAGALASLRLTKPGGCIGIVLPTSIFADQASSPFRCALYSSLSIKTIFWCPAEARLFDGVDQSFVYLIGCMGVASSTLRLTRFDRDLKVLDTRSIGISYGSDRPLPFATNGAQDELLVRIRKRHPTLRSLEEDSKVGLWLGRELDETRIGQAFSAARHGVPFLRGRAVFPYEVRETSPARIDPALRNIPNTIRCKRIAWRDVSRPTQRRRMHVALVPDGWITGNSLGVAYFRERSEEYLRILLGLFNSLVFELQVRAMLATAHISQGILRDCAIPSKAFTGGRDFNRLLRYVSERIQSREEDDQHALEAQIEVAVARAYGLTQDDMAALLPAFPKLQTSERDLLLKAELWA